MRVELDVTCKMGSGAKVAEESRDDEIEEERSLVASHVKGILGSRNEDPQLLVLNCLTSPTPKIHGSY